MRTLISILSANRSKSATSAEINKTGSVSAKETAAAKEPPPAVNPAPPPSNPAPVKPLKRTVIQAPVLAADTASGAPDTDAILIKAQPSANKEQCVFMVNRPLFAGHSWWFPNFESAEGSALAEALFSVDGVESVLVHDSTVTVTRVDKSAADWLPLAKEVGSAIRGVLGSGAGAIAEKIVREMPAEQQIREDIQRVIDTEVNPGVAGHGGRISLISVKGNAVTIQMGGGCQGCSAADVTLKMGIHNSFRKAVPMVGAIYDETDHAAGANPYFSRG
ncbi:MAG: NifU family protein [Nitrospinae bacterium]|nr:NifU family protein [Nitrospinota bacterium]